jgi:hypothetical protein
MRRQSDALASPAASFIQSPSPRAAIFFSKNEFCSKAKHRTHGARPIVIVARLFSVPVTSSANKGVAHVSTWLKLAANRDACMLR